jgi:DNA polymerase III alpha subunit
MAKPKLQFSLNLQQCKRFVDGYIKRGIKREISAKSQQNILLMAQFADCRCERRDIVAYNYLAFQTSYLIVHFLEQLYVAVLSNETHNTTELFKYSK